MAKPYLILSCDGGGVRGLLSALVLKELDPDRRRPAQSRWTCSGHVRRGPHRPRPGRGLGIDRVINLYKTKSAQIFTQ